jgi:hypothetical protein
MQVDRVNLNDSIFNNSFYIIDELKAILKSVGLQIIGVRSTLLQPPTEEPLHFELSRKGYYKEAGFVAIKLGKN